MTTRPRSVCMAFTLILINILIWLAFSIIVTANLHPAIPNQHLIKTIMASLAFVIAALLSVLLFFLSRQNHTAYFLALGLFVSLSFAAIFDDFGLIDLVVLVINVAPMALLIKDRSWYLQAKARSINNQKTA